MEQRKRSTASVSTVHCGRCFHLKREVQLKSPAKSVPKSLSKCNVRTNCPDLIDVFHLNRGLVYTCAIPRNCNIETTSKKVELLVDKSDIESISNFQIIL